ncbi:MAG: FHA domain-containing protein, partial [Mycobacterium sp.]|nr:FHA domain-containing protein [Mycobacterium sp.]MBV9721614.1 FHA domain-containing protein [Mycobacterium sp.]
MPTEAFASPLIVWVGPRRYSFPVGRDVTIGRDSRADIRLDGVGTSVSPTHAVLHHNGRQWIAVDRSEGGIYVDGVRISTVFIHDGRAITLGDPQHGPRLVFQLGVPPAPPPRFVPRPRMQHAPPPPPPAPYRPPSRPGWQPPAGPPPRFHQPKGPTVPPAPVTPTQRAPQPVGPPPAPPPPVHPFHQPVPPQPPPAPPPAAFSPRPVPPHRPPSAQPSQAQPQPEPAEPSSPRKRAAFVERLTGAMQKLGPQRSQPLPHDSRQAVPDTPAPQPRPHEAAPTTHLPRPDTPDAPETSVVKPPPPRPTGKA